MARNRLLPAPAAARRLSVLALLVLCITAWNLNAASAASADAGSSAKEWSNEKQGVHVLNVTNFDSSLRDGKVWLIEVRHLFCFLKSCERSRPHASARPVLHALSNRYLFRSSTLHGKLTPL